MRGRTEASRPRADPPTLEDGQALAWLVVALLFAGVGLRVWIMTGPLGALDSDEAIVGLMARRIPRELPAFFWGQGFGGTQEAILAAAAMRLFGSSVLVLKLVPMGLAALAALLTWRIGRRTVGEPAASVGAALFWAGPAAFVWWSTKERGHYWAALVLGLAAVLLILRLAEEHGPWLPQTLALGLVAGLGWWASAHVGLLVVPAAAWLVVRDRRYLLRSGAAFPTAVLGALPWLVVSARTGWATLDPGRQPGPNGYFDHLHGFFAEGLPRALGLRVPFMETWLPWGVGIPLYALLLAGFGWAMIRRPDGWGPLLVLAGAYPLLFALSPVVWWLEEARYILFLGPVASLLVAGAVSVDIPVALSRTVRLTGTSVVVVALSAAALGLMTAVPIAPVAPDAPVAADLGPLIRTLERRGVDRVFAHYWIAHRLTFESGERIVATRPMGDVRSEELDRSVREAPSPGYVFVTGSETHLWFLEALDRIGADHRRFETPDDRFTVFLPSGRLLPDDVAEVWGRG